MSAGYGARTVIERVRLTVHPGDRIGLLGPNGAGKSTLIKLLAGSLEARAGELTAARDLEIGYFAQHQVEQLRPDSSPLEHLKRLDPQARESELRGWLGSYGFSGDSVFMHTAPFSGGEKSRLALALLAYQRPNLLLLDEPTNHLDLEMRQSLASALQDYEGAMVIVSHDRHLLRVATDTLLLVHGGRVEEFDGSLDDYPDWLAAEQRNAAAGTEAAAGNGANSSAARKARKRQEAEKRRLLGPLRRRMQKWERGIESLQAEQSALDAKLGDESLYGNDSKAALADLLAARARNKQALEDAELAWLRACDELETMEEQCPETEPPAQR